MLIQQVWVIESRHVAWLLIELHLFQVQLWIEAWSDLVQFDLDMVVSCVTVTRWNAENVELHLLLHSGKAELLLHRPSLEDGVLQ